MLLFPLHNVEGHPTLAGISETNSQSTPCTQYIKNTVKLYTQEYTHSIKTRTL